jgi:hypothetical protein
MAVLAKRGQVLCPPEILCRVDLELLAGAPGQVAARFKAGIASLPDSDCTRQTAGCLATTSLWAFSRPNRSTHW